jgi:putative flippase GtrA
MRRLADMQIVRFAIVGAAVAALYVALFTGFLALGLPRSAANGLAFGIAVAVQYAAQTLWTFGKPLAVPDQLFRFLCTIGLGYAVSVLITAVIGPLAGWADWVAAAAVTVVLPVQNYVIFRIWVFAEGRTVQGRL